jgi:hypothetical protein
MQGPPESDLAIAASQFGDGGQSNLVRADRVPAEATTAVQATAGPWRPSGT